MTFFYVRLMLILAILLSVVMVLAMLIGEARRADMLAYTSGEAPAQLYLLDLHTRDTFQISTDTTLGHQTPRWSPAGDALAFTASTGGATHIYTLHLPEREFRQWSSVAGNSVADSYPLFREPYWTADGCCVVFHENRGLNENRRFYMTDMQAGTTTEVDVNTPQIQAYLSDLFPSRSPSPNGERVADIGFGDRVFRLMVGDVTDNAAAYAVSVIELYRTTEAATILSESIRWSPDSTRLVFAEQGAQNMIYLVEDQPGAAVQPLVTGTIADWRP